MASTYGATLRKRAAAAGFNLSAATIGSSSLRRAKETAALLFPAAAERLVVLPHLSEHGKIPENTPLNHPLTAPGWEQFLKHVHTMEAKEPLQLIAVSHGSYLREVWQELTGRRIASFSNLDAFVLEGEVEAGGKLTLISQPTFIKYTGIKPTEARTENDRCPLPAATSTVRKRSRRRVSHRRKTQRKSRR
jgi:hypothetical protein